MWFGGAVTLVVTGIIAGYVVEWTKGTPPSQIGAVLWAPFGTRIAAFARWLEAPAPITHGRMLLLTLALAATLAVLIVNSVRALARARRVPADFKPTGVQLAALGWMLKTYNTPQGLFTLQERFGDLTQNAGGKAFLARQMEDLARANVLRVIKYAGADDFYELTPQGRDWILDQIERVSQRERLA